MTALKTYERLECTGLWRLDRETQRREVVVSFGQASLVLNNIQNKPLTHWSLAAIEMHKGEGGQTILKPGDLLYVPSRYYHCAFPKSSRLSISIPCLNVIDLLYEDVTTMQADMNIYKF